MTEKHTPRFTSSSGAISLHEVERILAEASEIIDELKDSAVAILNGVIIDGSGGGRMVPETDLKALRAAVYKYWEYLKMAPLTPEDKVFGEENESPGNC